MTPDLARLAAAGVGIGELTKATMFTPLTIRSTAAVVHLTQDKRAIVDADVWPVVGLHLWQAKPDNRRWYAVTHIRSHEIRLHQLLCPCVQGYVPDHKDGDGLNNRRDNLRPATRQQNGANTRRAKPSSTGYRGAYWDKSVGRYVAKIMLRGKLKHLGRYDQPEDAARAYDKAAREVYGEFATTNFPASALAKC